MQIIAARPGWELFLCRPPTAHWRDLKLVVAGRKRKHCWWFGFSGEEGRLSRSRDAIHLAEHEPEIFQWVLDELTRLNSQRLAEPRSQPNVRGMR
jgi:hypothetical protein